MTSIEKVKSLVFYYKIKLLHRNVKIQLKNYIEGKIELRVHDTSTVSIGKGLHAMGPLYIKTLSNSVLTIGNGVFFNHNCSITSAKHITIGEKCTFGNNVVIVDHNHNYKHIGNEPFIADDIYIGDRVWIGANVTILKGSHIGNDCVIAANTIVSGHYSDAQLIRNEIVVKASNIPKGECHE